MHLGDYQCIVMHTNAFLNSLDHGIILHAGQGSAGQCRLVQGNVIQWMAA